VSSDATITFYPHSEQVEQVRIRNKSSFLTTIN